jgi:hypothetical protein
MSLSVEQLGGIGGWRQDVRLAQGRQVGATAEDDGDSRVVVVSVGRKRRSRCPGRWRSWRRLLRLQGVERRQETCAPARPRRRITARMLACPVECRPGLNDAAWAHNPEVAGFESRRALHQGTRPVADRGTCAGIGNGEVAGVSAGGSEGWVPGVPGGSPVSPGGGP